MTKVFEENQDDQGQVKSVTVQSSNGLVLDRPISRLVLQLESPERRPGIQGSMRSRVLNQILEGRERCVVLSVNQFW